MWIDAHMHIGSLDRIVEARRWFESLGLAGCWILSLPVVPGADPHYERNFNPEVLAAKAAIGPSARAFGCLDHSNLADGKGLSHHLAEQVATLWDAGFDGLKLWEGKPEVRDVLQARLDDPRLLDAYRAAGERGMPIIMHVADPRDFWISGAGPWDYTKIDLPSFDQLLEEFESAVAACPGTRFIGAHALFLADDPPALRRLLDTYDNLMIDLATGDYLYPSWGGDDAKRSDAKAFVERYSDRILFGSDAFFFPKNMRLLRTISEYVNLERTLRLQRFLGERCAFANPFVPRFDRYPVLRGISLTQPALGHVAHDNAARLLPTARPLDADTVSDYLDRWAPSGDVRADRAKAVIAQELAR